MIIFKLNKRIKKFDNLYIHWTDFYFMIFYFYKKLSKNTAKQKKN